MDKEACMIPKSVQILNHKYSIKLAKHLARDQGIEGVCNGNTKAILIDADLDKNETLECLMHEIIHAYQFESGFSQVLDRQAQELLAEGFASFICAILKIQFK